MHRATDAGGIAVDWARERIAAVLDTQRVRANDPAAGASFDEIRRAVVEVALAHHLVSPYTSLVAVDVTPVRADDEALHTHAMKTNLPHGWDHSAVFGTGQGATSASLQLVLGVAALLAAACIGAWLRIGRARRWSAI